MTFVINYATIIAFIALSIGILLQIRKIFKRKSVKDISIAEVSIRLSATFLIWLKIIMTHDSYLLLGQSLVLFVYSSYLLIILSYKFKSAA